MNVGGGGGGKPGQASQDCDLNLAPIIDCFTVLITFMLASASFLAIGILDAQIAVPGTSSTPNQKPPAINVDVELGLQHEIKLKVTGKSKIDKKIPAKNDDWDTATLGAEVQNLVQRFPDTESLVLSAQNDIEYQNVIQVMESLKGKIKAVLLGGF